MFFKKKLRTLFEVSAIFHHEKNISSKKPLSLTVLEKKVNDYTQEKYPIHWVNVPVDKSRSYIFYYYEHNPKGWNFL